MRTFLRQVHIKVRNSHAYYAYGVWSMEGRRGYFKFQSSSRRFVYRWHLIMQSTRAWPKLSNYRRRPQKWYSINCGHAMCIRLTYVCLSILSTVIAMIVRFWSIKFSADEKDKNFYTYIEWQDVLCIPTVNLVSKNLTLR